MKKALVLSALIAPCAAFARDASFEKAPYMDAALGVEARLDDLVSRMTLEEKIAAISTTKGFNTYEIRDGKVHPTKELEELYARFPGCGLSSFFRADWYSGRNWSNGLVRPEMMIDAYNAVQRYAVEKTRLGIRSMRKDGFAEAIAAAKSADAVVQMYIHDVKFTVARPQWELRGFQRVTLEPGERKTVSFELTAKELGYWNRDVEYVVEPGDFKVAVWDRFEPWFGAAHCVMYTAKTANR